MNGDLHDYQKLFDAIDVMVFVISPGGIILACNRAVTTRLGYLKEELLDNHVSVIHPAGSSQEIFNVLDSLNYSDETVCNLPLVDKLGRRVEVETRIYKGSWEGQPVLFGFSSDISTKRAMERKYEAVFDRSPVPILVSRILDGIITEVNQAWCDVTGYCKDEVIGRSTLSLGVWRSEQERLRIIDQLKLDGSVSNEPVDLISSTGAIIHGTISASLVTIDGDHLWVTTFVDHTEQLQFQKQIDAIREIAITSAVEKLDKQLRKNKYIRVATS